MSEDVAKTRMRFDAHPPIVSERLIPLHFDTNEGSQTVYALLKNNEELTEDRIETAAQAVFTSLWLQKSNFYNLLTDYIFEEEYPAVSKSFLNELRIILIQHIVSRYADWMQKELDKLDRTQHAKRLRHYRAGLIQYNLRTNERLINIDKNALLILITDLLKEWPGDSIFHNTYLRVYEWAAREVLNTPEKDSEYYGELRKHLADNEKLPTDEEIQSEERLYEHLIFLRTQIHGNQLIQEGGVELAVEPTINMLSLHHIENNPFSLDQLERIFGLVINNNSGLKDIPIPTGDGLTAITEGLNAAANNTWICNEYGEWCYQTNPLPDGLVVKLILNEDIRKPQKVMEHLKQKLLADIDSLTVYLNTLLCSISETQPEPWQADFLVDTKDLANKVNMGRLGRLSQSKQSTEILRRVRALSQVKVLIYWIDEGKELTRETSNLWILTDRAKWKPGQDESNAEPYRYELKLKPGNWVNHCLATENKHRDIHGTAYIPKELLKQKHTLMTSMHLWYEQTQRTQFTVSEWMTGIYGHVKFNSKLQDRKAKSKFKKDVRKAVQHLKDKVEPSFKIIKSNNWWANEVVKQIQPVQPIPVSDLIKQLRQQKGLSQKDLGEAVNYSQSRISQIERDPANNPGTAEKLLEYLRKRTNPE